MIILTGIILVFAAGTNQFILLKKMVTVFGILS